MKVAIVGDTHCNLEYLRQVLNYFTKDEHVDLFIHLGDDYQDATVIKEYSVEYIAVPGVYDKEYLDPSITNRLVTQIGGKRVLVSHTSASHSNDLPGDIIPEKLISQREIDILLFAHTHIYEVSFRDGILYINPGHLKVSDKKGASATIALLDISEKMLIASIFAFHGMREILQLKILT